MHHGRPAHPSDVPDIRLLSGVDEVVPATVPAVEYRLCFFALGLFFFFDFDNHFVHVAVVIHSHARAIFGPDYRAGEVEVLHLHRVHEGHVALVARAHVEHSAGARSLFEARHKGLAEGDELLLLHVVVEDAALAMALVVHVVGRVGGHQLEEEGGDQGDDALSRDGYWHGQTQRGWAPA